VTVLALAGRMIDATGAEVPRFPTENAAMVRARLRALIVDQEVRSLVCSATAGADLLALDAALEQGLRVRVVLPFARERFRRTSVIDRPGDFGPLFDRIVDAVEAKGALLVLDGEATPDASYRAANLAVLDEAATLARPDPPVAVVVWEGRSRGPDDNTAGFASAARERGWRLLEVSTL
jgi:hypothetical protein